MVSFNKVSAIYEEEDKPALCNISRIIEDGEFVVVTGSSGVGKTTLIKLLLKEIEPSAGSIVVDGTDLSKIRPSGIPRYRRKLGVIFQDFRLVRDMNVYDNLEIARRIAGFSSRDSEAKIRNVLSFLGIDHLHKRFPNELSGGEKQKVCLARAIINDPKILLADEPTGNLDPASSASLIKLMDLINRQGTTIIMTSHDYPNIKQEAPLVSEFKLPETEVKGYA